jgi:hypothetical protein
MASLMLQLWSRLVSIVPGEFPWHKTHDTLLAGHLLASNQAHDLTSMAVQYLAINIKPYEDALGIAVKEARGYCRRNLPDWRIAKHGLPEMPSCPKSKKDKAGRGEDRDSAWKYDMWLPKLLAKKLDYPKDHPYWNVLETYSNADSYVTLKLWIVMEQELKKRDLWEIYYRVRRKLYPILHDMEHYGVTVNKARLDRLKTEYLKESQEAGNVCRNIAASYGYNLNLPKAGKNNSLTGFLFGDGPGSMKLPIVAETDTGLPSLDKFAMAEYLTTLASGSKELLFMKNLVAKRKRDTASRLSSIL